MKFFILFSIFITSTLVSAQSEIYRPKKMSCSDLKESLEKYQTITVRYGVFDISRYTLYVSPKDARQTCGVDEIAMSATFRTKDSRSCMVGYTCENIRSPGVQNRR